MDKAVGGFHLLDQGAIHRFPGRVEREIRPSWLEFSVQFGQQCRLPFFLVTVEFREKYSELLVVGVHQQIGQEGWIVGSIIR